MSLWRSLSGKLTGPAPLTVVNDPVLGRLTWDAWGKSWETQPMAAGLPYILQIDRCGKDTAPPDACLAVARRIVLDQAAVARRLRTLAEQEAERRPHRAAIILSLRISRIRMRVADARVEGEISLDSDPPEYGWACMHVDGMPTNIYQQTE